MAKRLGNGRKVNAKFWPWGMPWEPSYDHFGVLCRASFLFNIGYFEVYRVYEGIWRLSKVYGGYLKYIKVYGSIWRYINAPPSSLPVYPTLFDLIRCHFAGF